MQRNKFGKIRPIEYQYISNAPKQKNCISNIYCDREFLLSEELELPLQSQENQRCPEINLKIGNVATYALIDSGANISCISEEWYNHNKKNLQNYEELPVTSISIKTALGSKSKRIQRILLLPMQLQDQETLIQCIVVPNLIKPMIIGTDVMSQLEMELNFKKNQINININNTDISLKFEEVTNDGILCYICNNGNMNTNEQRINNKCEDVNDGTDTTELIYKEVNENPRLNEEQRQRFVELMLKYSYIFSDTPGICNKYVHRLNVKDHNNYKCQNYPVPLIYQEAVSVEIERMLNQENPPTMCALLMDFMCMGRSMYPPSEGIFPLC